MGEGINDTPSLKLAHLGIVVNNAADVSREVADIVLLEKDLKVIVDGVKEGRNIFSNINKYMKCTLSGNFGNFYSIAIISLFLPFLPLLPIQILLINLLTDFPLLSMATDRVDPKELRKPKLYQLNKVMGLIIVLALINAISDLVFFGIFYKVQVPLFQTLWFILSVLTEIVLIFSIRTSGFFIKAKRPHLLLVSLSLLVAAITILLPFTGFGREIFHFVRPPLSPFLLILIIVFGYFALSEIAKLIYFRYKKFDYKK